MRRQRHIEAGLMPSRRRLFDTVVWSGALLFLLLFGLHEARASEERFDPGPAAYREECGACHVAFPAALLSPSEWAAVLGRLDHHYGSDATPDRKNMAALRTYLLGAEAHTPGRASSVGDLPRISAQRWFLKEHRRVAQRARQPDIKSLSNCAACHSGAAQGDFSESSLIVHR